jgi:hypothetical protein
MYLRINAISIKMIMIFFIELEKEIKTLMESQKGPE